MQVYKKSGANIRSRAPSATHSLNRLHAALLASTMIVGAPALSEAADIQTLGSLGGSAVFLGSNPISADGTVVVGASNITGNTARHAFRWSGGVMTDIGTLPGGGTYSRAYGVSGDGNVVVGEASIAGDAINHAFSWTAGGGMIDLGTLGGSNSLAYAASANGSVIVGRSEITGNTNTRAFRWSGGVMTDLGTLAGHTDSEAVGVSADGSVVAGNSSDPAMGTSIAFRWVGGVMTGLGTLGGVTSTAAALSADGSTVVGVADNSVSGHAFRWNSGVMTDLGTLGGIQSNANAVSANGAVVVGSAEDAGFVTRAFRWTAATGMQSVESLLATAGVSLAPGRYLQNANGVSADGSVIVGKYDNGPLYIARLSSSATGIITTDEAARSFASLGALGQTGNAAISSSLGTMSQYATQTQNGGSNPNAQFSVFATGGYDTDPTASGSLGLTMKLGNNIIAGAMLEADHIKTNMATNGGAKMNGGGGGLFIAAMPDTGLQWLASASVLTIKGDITRGYLNGNAPASSTGSTRGNGFGALARIGWAFDAMKGVKITPFASYTLTSIKFNGYTETDGVFAAQIDDFTDRAQTSRLGADARYTFAPGQWLWGGLTWAHRVDGGKTADVSGTLIGLFPIGTTGVAFAKDWAEATAGIRLPLGTAGSAVTASVTASIPSHQATTYMARIGLSQSF
ncbi:autotransporter domain-containing protein [Undibacter mobilis]|uniref:autotransporter domain-containing protein n=1 Tax=Undibacter mobilis TaxID=2292256 RepID=UPI0011C031E0|nr:autotransporter domain-containing protein [Undibacter mobilis]